GRQSGTQRVSFFIPRATTLTSSCRKLYTDFPVKGFRYPDVHGRICRRGSGGGRSAGRTGGERQQIALGVYAPAASHAGEVLVTPQRSATGRPSCSRLAPF